MSLNESPFSNKTTIFKKNLDSTRPFQQSKHSSYTNNRTWYVTKCEIWKKKLKISNIKINNLFKRHEICSDETDELKSKIEILEDKVRNYFEKNRKLKADNENAEINEGNLITWFIKTRGTKEWDHHLAKNMNFFWKSQQKWKHIEKVIEY